MEKRSLPGFLKGIISDFNSAGVFALKENANKAIDEAALSNDRQLAKLALISYCLSKMLSKQHIVRHDKWSDIRHDILFDLRKASKSLAGNDLEGFTASLEAVIESVRNIDEKMGNYVQNLFEKAKVKYASRAYSMGLGLGQSAALTGAEKKDLLKYVGFTRIADREDISLGIGERLKRLKGKIGGP